MHDIQGSGKKTLTLLKFNIEIFSDDTLIVCVLAGLFFPPILFVYFPWIGRARSHSLSLSHSHQLTLSYWVRSTTNFFTLGVDSIFFLLSFLMLFVVLFSLYSVMFCVYHTRPFAFKRQTEFNITLARARTHTHTHAPCIPQPVSNVRETLHTRKSSWCAGSTEQVKIQKKAHTKKKEHCKPAEEPKRSSSRSLSCLYGVIQNSHNSSLRTTEYRWPISATNQFAFRHRFREVIQIQLAHEQLVDSTLFDLRHLSFWQL